MSWTFVNVESVISLNEYLNWYIKCIYKRLFNLSETILI